MDPLSIVASSIAVLQAITAAGSGLRKLLSLRNAPIELQALINEVEALKSLLLIICESLRSTAVTTGHGELREALNALIRPMRNAVLDLETKVEFDLKQSKNLAHRGLPKPSKMRWLLPGAEVHKLKQAIRDNRDNLHAGLTALGISLAEQERQMVLQIQSVGLFTRQDLRALRVDQQQHMASLSDALVLQQTSLSTIDSRLDALKTQVERLDLTSIPLKPLDDHSGAVVTDTTSNSPNTVCITASIRAARCPPSCRCCCHIATRSETPRWLRSIIGQLMLSYNPFIQTNPCNLTECRKSNRRINLTYYFPWWLASRALMVAGDMRDLSGMGASWSIKMPVVVPSTHFIWSYVDSNNLSGLQNGLRDAGYSPWIVDEDRETLLHTAASLSRYCMAKWLISAGARQNAQNDIGSTPVMRLLIKTQNSDRDSLQQLGLDTEDVADDLVFTPIHHAIVLRSQSKPRSLTVDLLKRHSGVVDATDRCGNTALHWASARGDLDAVRLLLSRKASHALRDNDGRTALHRACSANSDGCTLALLEAGAAVEATDRFGATPLFYVCKASTAELLLQRGASVGHHNHRGQNALYPAVLIDLAAGVETMLAWGADVTVADHHGLTAFHCAIEGNSEKSLGVMLGHLDTISTRHHDGRLSSLATRKGARLRQRDTACTVLTAVGIRGQNVLHFAGMFAGPSLMYVLAGADLQGTNPLHRDRDGDTPDDCFYNFRDQTCTMIRAPFKEEEMAWATLMDSARRQNGLLVDSNADEPGTESRGDFKAMCDDAEDEDFFDAAE